MYVMNQDSPLYEFLNRWDRGFIREIERGESRITFCTLFWRTLWVIAVLMIVGVIVGLAAYVLIGSVLTYVTMISYAVGIQFFDIINVTLFPWFPAIVGVTGAIAIYIMILLVREVFRCIIRGVNFIKSKRKPPEIKAPKSPGFFATWYKSHKEKYCPLVTIEKSNEMDDRYDD